MNELRDSSLIENAEREEFKRLFEVTRDNIKSYTETESIDNYGSRRLSVLNSNFYWNENQKIFGIEFSINRNDLIGTARYYFDLEDGSVALYGAIGRNSGLEAYPDLIYAPSDHNLGILEHARRDPINIDLVKLKELSSFADNPIKNRNLVQDLAYLPGEEEFYRK